jgi:hypothetical protein
MLYIAFLKASGSTPMERIGRRLQWQYPEGIQLVAEYWPQSADMSVVSIFETDSIASIFAVTAEWSDVFDVTVVPTLTAEQGMALAQQMMQG